MTSSNWSFRSTWKGCYYVRRKKKSILVHIKWHIVKTMNVNVKNPTKPYSAPPYIQIKTDKRVQFSRVCYKNLVHRLWSTENLVCSELQREGKSHFFTLGSEVRDYHKVKTDFLGQEGGHHWAEHAHKNGMQNIFGVFFCQWVCWACMGLCRYMGKGFSRAEKGTNLHCERLLVYSLVVFLSFFLPHWAGSAGSSPG